jgi:hypothetical protein
MRTHAYASGQYVPSDDAPVAFLVVPPLIPCDYGPATVAFFQLLQDFILGCTVAKQVASCLDRHQVCI